MKPHVRVGVLNDMGDGPDAPGDVSFWLRREVAAVQAAGRLDADVELVHAWGLGLPTGSADAVERAFMDLVRQDVALIVGPAIGDNALAATPWVEREHVPTINWAGAERARGQWMFHLQVGSHEDESLVIARHLRGRGASSVSVAYDESPIGTRHLHYLRDEAARVGLAVIDAVPISPVQDDAVEAVSRLVRGRPAGIAYLGLGLSAPAVARALTATGWQGPRVMNTAGLRGYGGDFAAICDGWTYVDMHADGNRTLAALRAEPDVPAQPAVWAAKGHDLGRLVAEGLARSGNVTREGVAAGLERIKWLPAAEGEEGTLLGFGVHDRGALHGGYLVTREWRDGKSFQWAAEAAG